MSVTESFHAWRMVPQQQPARPFRFERVDEPLPEIGPEEALVEVAACGICGTDIGYFFGDVAPVVTPPLTLGHEISGRVMRGGLQGRQVVVPTIVPCRSCELCRAGRANRCVRQRMLGGNYAIQGGFASHVVVPARELAPVPEDSPIPLERLAVVADAVSTPYQAALRAGIAPSDKVIVIGATGGLGVYLSQWAKHMGAELVVGIARDQARLEALVPYGVDVPIATGDQGVDDIRHDVWRACGSRGVNPRHSWKIFEVSGTLAGQELSLSLLTFACKLVLVGFAPGELRYTLSKVVAYDAEIVGSWGCDPALYPRVIEHVVAGDIQILPFIETRPMQTISASFDDVRQRRTGLKRIVLTADWQAGAAAGGGNQNGG